MSEPGLCCLDVDPFDDHDGRIGAAEIMEAEATQTSCFRCLAENGRETIWRLSPRQDQARGMAVW